MVLFKKDKERMRFLEERVRFLDEEVMRLHKRNTELVRQMEGEHIASPYCIGCEHSVQGPLSGQLYCKLECKCKDYKTAARLEA